MPPNNVIAPKSSSKRPAIILAIVLGLCFLLAMVLAVRLVVTKSAAASNAKCNGLEHDAQPHLIPLFDQATIDAKTYKCRALFGATPQRTTHITFLLRGAPEPGQTMAGLQQKISQQLVAAGWEARQVTLSEVNYDYVLADKPQIGASFTVLSPKHNLFWLQIGLEDGYQPTITNRAKPVDIPVPHDEFDKYRSFTVLTPTLVPDGYDGWRKTAAQYEENDTSLQFELVGGTGKVQVRLFQSLADSPDEVHAKCAPQQCSQVATGKWGNPVYVSRDGITLSTVIGDTEITATGFDNTYVKPAVSRQTGVAILGSLQ
jgi:hypothetical protein